MTADSGFAIKRRAVHEKGATIFRQGEPFTAVQVVVSGFVKLLEVDGDGREHVVALRIPGDLIGIEAWATGIHPQTGQALTGVHLCVLRWPQSIRGVTTGPLLEKLLAKAATQLERSTRLWQDRPAVERVRLFLERFAADIEVSSKLPITRSEMGSLLGLAEGTVVRAIAQLRAERLSQQ